MYKLISKNTIFAVICDDESYDYYLVKALTESYELDNRETDSWDITYESGTKVIKGHYFKQDENPLRRHKILVLLRTKYDL